MLDFSALNIKNPYIIEFILANTEDGEGRCDRSFEVDGDDLYDTDTVKNIFDFESRENIKTDKYDFARACLIQQMKHICSVSIIGNIADELEVYRVALELTFKVSEDRSTLEITDATLEYDYTYTQSDSEMLRQSEIISSNQRARNPETDMSSWLDTIALGCNIPMPPVPITPGVGLSSRKLEL